MTFKVSPRARLVLGAAALALVDGAAGYGIAHLSGERSEDTPAMETQGRKILYWYDPMVPSQHFDKPGKSPLLDKQLVPKSAAEADGEAGVPLDHPPTHLWG